MKPLKWIPWVLLAVWALWAPAPGRVNAQGDEDAHYFAETGHYVQGAFWAFYQSVPDAARVIGYPITEQLVRDGRLVQYFENMRLEQLPGEPVRPAPVGQELYTPLPGLMVNNPTACLHFERTGYSVCYAFREFFEAHGGEAVFGAPISSFVFYNHRLVQYFENARLEWQPWRPEGQKVTVAPLGMASFLASGEDPALRRAIAPAARLQPISLDVRAFVARPVVRPSGQQRVYVILRDQALQPLAGVQGVAFFTWPDGQQTWLPFETNDLGVGTLQVEFADLPVGSVVEIRVQVQSRGLHGEAVTSFRVWR